jgi:MarR family 2-MHQ and catechol resistance regulon transcriptional repressor
MENNSKDYGPANRLNLHVVIGIYRSYSKINRSTQKLLTPYNLTVPQFGVLEALYHLGEMNIGDIIAKTLSTSGNMTVVIRNLEQVGLINRVTDPKDRRAYLVELTEKGKRLIEKNFPEHLKDLQKVFGNLANQEKEQLISLVKKMNKDI